MFKFPTSVHEVPSYFSTALEPVPEPAYPPTAKPAVCVPDPDKGALAVFKLFPSAHAEPFHSSELTVLGVPPPKINPAVLLVAAPAAAKGRQSFCRRVPQRLSRTRHGV